MPLRLNPQLCPELTHSPGGSSQGGVRARAQAESSAHPVHTQIIVPGEGCKDRGIRGTLPWGSAAPGAPLPVGRMLQIPPPRNTYCHSTEDLEAKPVWIKGRTTTETKPTPLPFSPASQPCRDSQGLQHTPKAAPVLSLDSPSPPQMEFGWVKHNTAALTSFPAVKVQFLALSPGI